MVNTTDAISKAIAPLMQGTMMDRLDIDPREPNGNQTDLSTTAARLHSASV